MEKKHMFMKKKSSTMLFYFFHIRKAFLEGTSKNSMAFLQCRLAEKKLEWRHCEGEKRNASKISSQKFD
jgi:hypothetical protein